MGSKNRITIKEIAKKANVSIGTVDRVIHNRGKVSAEKEKLIRKIMEEENYKPNIFARNLKLSKTFVFGAIIPQPAQDSHYWELPEAGIKKAADELANRNVKIKYYYFDKSSIADFKKICNQAKNAGLDGILIAPVLTKEAQQFLNNLPNDLPYVLIDSNIPETNHISYIGQDSYASGRMAGKLMKLLLDEHSNIAIITDIPYDYHIQERTEGFVSYLKEHDGYNIKKYDTSQMKSGAKPSDLINKVLKKINNLDGIFVPNANVHFVAKYIKEHYDKNKIRIIGYDLLPENKKYLAEEVIDFIIDQSPNEQGMQGIMALYKKLILKENPPDQIIMPINIATKENMNYF